MTNGEALRLADALDAYCTPQDVSELAAAELRRLHAENERCREVCKATSECWRADAAEWQAQRDVLLKALKNVYKEFRKYGRQHWPEAVKARAAIDKAEGKA